MFLIPLLLLFANRVRGSQEAGDFLFFVAWAACCAFVGFPAWQCLLSGGFMWLAQARSWGEALGAIGGWFEGKFEGVNWIVWLLRPFEKDVFLWGVLHTLMRGLYFTLPFIALGLWLPAVIAPFCFFGTYYCFIKLEQWALKRDGWEIAEYGFGAILGLLLIIGMVV